MGNQVRIYPVPAAGIAPLLTARNGGTVDGARLHKLGRLINTCAGVRRKCLGRVYVPPSSVLDSATDTVVWRFMGHTSVNASVVRYQMVFMPANSYSASISPRFWWVRKTLDTSAQPATVTATATQDAQYVTRRSTATIVPNDYFAVTGALAVAGATTYAWELHTADNARPFACSLYEETRDGGYVDVASGTWVDTNNVRLSAPILDRDVADYIATMDSTWKNGGASLLNWTRHNGTAKTNASGVYANPTTTGTFYIAPADRATLTTTAIPSVAWVYAGVSAGTTGHFKLTRAAGTVAEVTAITTTAGYYTAAADLDASNSDELITPYHHGGTGTISTYAFGLYEYSA